MGKTLPLSINCHTFVTNVCTCLIDAPKCIRTHIYIPRNLNVGHIRIYKYMIRLELEPGKFVYDRGNGYSRFIMCHIKHLTNRLSNTKTQ